MHHEPHDHRHTHGEHSHASPRRGEDYAARTHPEFVVLDIGEDVGALIIHTDPDQHGIEIEISPTGQDCPRTHKQVLERTLNRRPAFTAVFDNLSAGRYALWVDGEARTREVLIEGSTITQLDWRTGAVPGASGGSPPPA